MNPINHSIYPLQTLVDQVTYKLSYNNNNNIITGSMLLIIYSYLHILRVESHTIHIHYPAVIFEETWGVNEFVYPTNPPIFMGKLTVHTLHFF